MVQNQNQQKLTNALAKWMILTSSLILQKKVYYYLSFHVEQHDKYKKKFKDAMLVKFVTQWKIVLIRFFFIPLRYVIR
jgi:hypothetical protein